MTTNHDSGNCGANQRDFGLVAAAALWAVSYLVALLLLKQATIAEPAKMWIAIAPVAPFAFFLMRWISHLRKLDELHQRMHLEALALAFPVAILLLMTIGLLERANPSQHWGEFREWYYLPLFYCIGLALSWRRYR